MRRADPLKPPNGASWQPLSGVAPTIQKEGVSTYDPITMGQASGTALGDGLQRAEGSSGRLICFGFGYVARALAKGLRAGRWRIYGTRRSLQDRERCEGRVELLQFDGSAADGDLLQVVTQATHLLVSIPPDVTGDLVLRRFEPALVAAGHLRWIGYLSSTGVYGNHDGAVVHETSTCSPTSDRAKRRLAAEEAWCALHQEQGLPVHIFRVAGIYGPGRSVLDRVRGGDTQRIQLKGHVFNRIHVDDIAAALIASMQLVNPGRIYNLSDDAPSPQCEMVEYACRLLGVEPGAKVPFERARERMSRPMADFWSDSRRVSNQRIKTELGVRLRYPSYREGLQAVLADT